MPDIAYIWNTSPLHLYLASIGHTDPHTNSSPHTRDVDLPKRKFPSIHHEWMNFFKNWLAEHIEASNKEFHMLCFRHGLFTEKMVDQGRSSSPHSREERNTFHSEYLRFYSHMPSCAKLNFWNLLTATTLLLMIFTILYFYPFFLPFVLLFIILCMICLFLCKWSMNLFISQVKLELVAFQRHWLLLKSYTHWTFQLNFICLFKSPQKPIYEEKTMLMHTTKFIEEIDKEYEGLLLFWDRSIKENREACYYKSIPQWVHTATIGQMLKLYNFISRDNILAWHYGERYECLYRYWLISSLYWKYLIDFIKLKFKAKMMDIIQIMKQMGKIINVHNEVKHPSPTVFEGLKPLETARDKQNVTDVHLQLQPNVIAYSEYDQDIHSNRASSEYINQIHSIKPLKVEPDPLQSSKSYPTIGPTLCTNNNTNSIPAELSSVKGYDPHELMSAIPSTTSNSYPYMDNIKKLNQRLNGIWIHQKDYCLSIQQTLLLLMNPPPWIPSNPLYVFIKMVYVFISHVNALRRLRIKLYKLSDFLYNHHIDSWLNKTHSIISPITLDQHYGEISYLHRLSPYNNDPTIQTRMIYENCYFPYTVTHTDDHTLQTKVKYHWKVCNAHLIKALISLRLREEVTQIEISRKDLGKVVDDLMIHLDEAAEHIHTLQTLVFEPAKTQKIERVTEPSLKHPITTPQVTPTEQKQVHPLLLPPNAPPQQLEIYTAMGRPEETENKLSIDLRTLLDFQKHNRDHCPPTLISELSNLAREAYLKRLRNNTNMPIMKKLEYDEDQDCEVINHEKLQPEDTLLSHDSNQPLDLPDEPALDLQTNYYKTRICKLDLKTKLVDEFLSARRNTQDKIHESPSDIESPFPEDNDSQRNGY